jgi:hypothetical protein
VSSIGTEMLTVLNKNLGVGLFIWPKEDLVGPPTSREERDIKLARQQRKQRFWTIGQSVTFFCLYHTHRQTDNDGKAQQGSLSVTRCNADTSYRIIIAIHQGVHVDFYAAAKSHTTQFHSH